MIYIPIIGAILEGAGMTIEKKILRKHNIDYKNYTVYGFLALVITMLPLVYFLWSIKPEAYDLKNILIFLTVIFFSLMANLLIFYSLKREELTEIEPIRLMQPLFTILLAFIFSFFFASYSSEKNFIILGLALIASVSLIASHIKKQHLSYNKHMIAALLGSFFFAVELVISRAILPYYSSLTFYFLRCLFIFLITAVIFQPNITSIQTKTKILILITGAIWVAYRLILYYGYLRYGVIFTTILFILAPVFIFLFARIFLKEKLSWKNIVSSIIIVACVVAVIIIEI